MSLVEHDAKAAAAPEPTIEGDGESAPRPTSEFPERYENRQQLAHGGMGEIRQAWDRVLRRDVAMKLLSWSLLDSARARARFQAEIELTAGLEHPGIVSVYDAGVLANGRPWYTMRLLDGRTLAAELARYYAPVVESHSESALSYLIGAYQRVCDAMVYAHARGVIHRDLKPQNIMVDARGEVLILDWGLARRAGKSETAPTRSENAEQASGVSSSGKPATPTEPLLTRAGDVLGTPGYLPPEQANAELERMSPASDVYSLGAILYEILCGAPPFTGDARALLGRAQDWAPAPLGPRINDTLRAAVAPLIALAEDCLALEASRRPAIEVVAERVGRYREDVQRAAAARAVVANVAELERETDTLGKQANEARLRARALLASLASYAHATEKQPGWQLHAEAETLERRAALHSVHRLQGLRAALTIDPHCAEAHAGLARHYAAALIAAEAQREPRAIAENEALLAEHDRGKYCALLEGKGALTLRTTPASRVTALRYVERLHRLVLEPAHDLGATPLLDVALPAGTYLLLLDAPNRATTRYPVHIRRGQHWSGVRPGSNETFPIVLPLATELDDSELCYVPAGWFGSGGDDRAVETLPERQIWVDGFVVQRRPVDNRGYLRFLNDLRLRGDDERALLYAPRMPRGSGGQSGASTLEEPLVYARTPRGEFTLAAPTAATPWELDAPVALIDWYAARAYASWLAARTGRPYRLLDELEWEKAARGVDGRLTAFGDRLEPTYACMLGSRAETPRPMATDAFPEDESPYGVRGTTGNMRTWCADIWAWDGPRVERGRLVPTAAHDEDLRPRAVRGGAWSAMPDFCRAAGRFALAPTERLLAVGLRLGYSVAE